MIRNGDQTAKRLAGGGASAQALSGPENGIPARIVNCEAKPELGAPARRGLCGFDGTEKTGAQTVSPANDLEPDTIRDTPGGLETEMLPEKAHQPSHFHGGPGPIVRGEGEQSQNADADLGCCLHYPPDRIRTGSMP
jgi:hypothetical protein